MNTPAPAGRVLSGMRPTGQLHLGNYHGALRNWVDLQYQNPCFFFVADFHALTTGYADTEQLPDFTHEMVVDWLAAGLNPGVATLFVQSHVPEHAELHLLLSMITPLSWLERVPTYKDQQAELAEKDLATYGFLGYPLLQSADILLARPAWVPVGEDQVAHVEITREIARRFNHIFGQETGFEAKAEKAIEALAKMVATETTVLRDGRKLRVHSEQLVPGDVVELRVGDKVRCAAWLRRKEGVCLERSALTNAFCASQVPADLRLGKLKTATLRVEQASLTGESVAVAKFTEAVKDDGAELQAQECMVFAGTTISNGQAVGIVACTGMATQIGCAACRSGAAARLRRITADATVCLAAPSRLTSRRPRRRRRTRR